jgi:hypothetical protein
MNKFSLSKSKMWSIGLSVYYVLSSFSAHAQTAKSVRLKVTRAHVNLFIHLDKSVYQPQETIWFTGYILNRDERLMQEQNTLYIVLVDPINRSVVTKRRFLIKNGFGKGFLSLPDTIDAGEYWILGYTNALLQTGDEPVFRQSISVRSGEPAPFRIVSSVPQILDDSLRIRYKISTSYGGLAAGGKFSFTLYDDSNAIETGEKTIDAFGEVVVAMASRPNAGKYWELKANVTRDGLSKKFRFPFPFDNMPFSPDLAAARSKKEDEPLPHAVATILPDSGEYHQRSKVTLHINIRDTAGRPVLGIFSLSVVSSKKISSTQSESISQFELLSEKGYSMQDPPSSLKELAGDAPDYGYVLLGDDKIRKPINIALLGNSFASFKTDSTGRFALPYDALVVPVGGANYISVADRSPERYKIVVVSRADTFDQRLASMNFPLSLVDKGAPSNVDEVASGTSPVTLKTAVVKAKVRSENNEFAGEYNSTHCEQDYVCTHNHGGPMLPDFLNCPCLGRDLNGPCKLVKPQEGARYLFLPKDKAHERTSGAKFVIYHCAAPTIPSFMKVLDPILDERPFPIPNSNGSNILGSGQQSTVYWNHLLSTNANGETIVTFYTNDLTGNFTCDLQGVSTLGVVSSRGSYAVVTQESVCANTTAQNSFVRGDR